MGETNHQAPEALLDKVRAVKVGVPKETATGEARVALIPEVVAKLTAQKLEVIVQKGAGAGASIEDKAYADAGAKLSTAKDAFGADVVVKVAKPSAEEIKLLKKDAILIGFLQPLNDPKGIDALAKRGVVGLAMESVPRITRAQAMDALSSQATVGGYKAVLIAADRLPKLFPMLMTAAGTIAPAKVLVIGAGVAGLQAIATARRLGAVVSAFDIRPAVREEIESLGASFLDLGIIGEETEGGYARELTPEQQKQQQTELEKRIPGFDVVVTTALVPGRPAPKLIPAKSAQAMAPGSVIVDLAAEMGGNCELTEPGKIVEKNGVAIVGLTNLPSDMAFHSSQLYARNVAALLGLLVKDGELALDFEDEIVAGACVTRKEEKS